MTHRSFSCVSSVSSQSGLTQMGENSPCGSSLPREEMLMQDLQEQSCNGIAYSSCKGFTNYVALYARRIEDGWEYAKNLQGA